MKKLTLTFMLLFVSYVFCSATTRIVDSHFPQPTGVYSTIQLAYDAASSGDTILISPAAGEYAGITIAKKIHIVGTGWSDASTTVPHTKTSSFTFNTGSGGSSITGLKLSGSIDINTDSITVKRNSCTKIYVRANCTNIVIIQNFIQEYLTWSLNWIYLSIISVENNSEVLISNNVIINTAYHPDYSNYSVYTQYPSNVIICNNILQGQDGAIILGMSGGNYLTHSVFNNIVLDGGISGVAATYDENNHNIANSTQFGTINNNQQNIDMNTVFVDLANHNYHLKEGSPAIGAGEGSADCGIYGGTFPFVDNGRTWLPMITEMSVPAIVNVADGLDISVKAKSGK